MDEKIIERQIDEIVNQFCSMPRANNTTLGKLKAFGSKKTKAINVDKVQDSLEYLRISVKYILFDLEATRRENKYLRQILDK